MTKIMSPEELEQELRAIGAERYHDKHPFHKLLHGGKLNKGQVQAWALNRYYYQATIPIKDATILARMPDPAMRRAWRQRIIDHDGEHEGEGGIERWTPGLRARGGLSLGSVLCFFFALAAERDDERSGGDANIAEPHDHPWNRETRGPKGYLLARAPVQDPKVEWAQAPSVSDRGEHNLRPGIVSPWSKPNLMV